MGEWETGGRRSEVLYIACLLSAVLMVYARAVGYQFTTFDDGIHVFENPLLHPPSLEHLWRAWRHPFLGLYIPVSYTVWSAVASLHPAPLDPRFFHGLNVLLHAVNSALAYLILRRMLPSAPKAALVGALLFAWHPLQVEAVVWCSALKDVLSGFFGLVCVWQYVSAIQEERHARRHYWTALAAFLLALLSKPVAVSLPLLVGAIEMVWFRVPWRQSLRRWGPWLCLALPIMVATKTQQPDGVIPFIAPWSQRALIAGDALTFYLSKLFFPLVLTLNYGRTPQSVLARPESPWLALVPLLFLVLLWRRADRRVWFLASLLFVINLLPVMGFIPFYYQSFSTVADRFVYLGMLGPALAVAWLAYHAGRSRVKLIASVALGSLCFAWLAAKSVVQLGYWHDNRSLVQHIAVWNREDPDIQYSLGVMAAEASQPPGSPSFYARLLRLPPPSPDPKAREASFREAVFHYEEALRLNPRHAPAHNNLGLLLASRGQWSEAAKHFRAALAVEPSLIAASNNLGVALANQADYDGAVVAFRSVLHASPRDESAHVNLGLALARKKEWKAAQREFSTTLEINPGNRLARVKLAEAEREAETVARP